MALARFRGRMPLIVFILLALVCLGLLGFACGCLDDRPAVALERALQAPALPGLIVVWAAIILGGFTAAAFVAAAAPVPVRASPALLQRFRF